MKNLSKEELSTWRNINAWLWLYETVEDLDRYPQQDRLEAYNLRNIFLEKCVEAFDIDESRPWMVSEATGNVIYLDEKEEKSDDTLHDKRQGSGD